MAWPVATKLTAWSYSRYSTYKQCPFKIKLSALGVPGVGKVKEPSSAPMERGDFIHKEAQAYLLGERRVVPKDLKPIGDELKRLRGFVKAGKAGVEENWAFREDWSETTWDDWAKCWLRVKVDAWHFEANNVLILTDWKTGKFSDYKLPDYVEQLDLYKLAALLRFAHIPNLRVGSRLVYTDHGIIYPSADTADVHYAAAADLPRLQKQWKARVKPMMNDQKFAPKANRFCSDCFYRSSNKAAGGGQCVY